jgi:hypothetical protein
MVGLPSLAELLPILSSVRRRRARRCARPPPPAPARGDRGGLSASCSRTLLPEPRVAILFVTAAAGAAAYAILRPARLDGAAARRATSCRARALELPDEHGGDRGPRDRGRRSRPSISATYAIDAETYAVSFVLLGLMRRMPPPANASARARRVVEGFATHGAGPSCSAPTRSTSPRCCSGCRLRSSRVAEELGGLGVSAFYAAPSIG